MSSDFVSEGFAKRVERELLGDVDIAIGVYRAFIRG
jgi:hypothetical protein